MDGIFEQGRIAQVNTERLQMSMAPDKKYWGRIKRALGMIKQKADSMHANIPLSDAQELNAEKPDWLASYPSESIFSLISQPRRFAHDEMKYDEQYNNPDPTDETVGYGLINLLQTIGADFGGPALEVGCGTGLLSVGLAKHGPHPQIILSDPSIEFLNDNVQDIVRKKNVHNIVQSNISLCLNNYSLHRC